LRLHLSRTERDEIEAALRLVDELEHAKVLALPPAGAVDRLREPVAGACCSTAFAQ